MQTVIEKGAAIRRRPAAVKPVPAMNAPLRERSETLLTWAVCALYALVAIASVWTYHGFLQDDAFITYQAARNFALGHGLVFNQGERYLSTSGPLYAVLLGVLGRWTPEAIPTISEALSALSLFAASCGLYAWGRLWSKPAFGFFAGLFYLAMPTVTPGIGFEVLPQAALVVWAFWSYFAARRSGREAIVAGVLLALAVLIRPDALIAAGALLAVVAVSVPRWRDEARVLSWRALAAFVGILLLAGICSAVYFGHAFPSTMAVKVAQTRSGAWASFGAGLDRQFVHDFPRWYKPLWMLYGLLPFGLVYAFRNPRAVALVAWPVLHSLAFILAKLPDGPWYFIPESVGFAVLAGLGAQALIDLCGKRGTMRVAVVSILCAAALFVSWRQVLTVGDDRRSRERLTPQIELYPRVADWLRTHTSASDRIGYYEVGLIGWLSNRRLVDPLGLVTPGQADAVASRRFDHAYQEFRPEYILAFRREDPPRSGHWVSAYGLDPDGAAWFTSSYVRVARLLGYGRAVDVFRKISVI